MTDKRSVASVCSHVRFQMWGTVERTSAALPLAEKRPYSWVTSKVSRQRVLRMETFTAVRVGAAVRRLNTLMLFLDNQINCWVYWKFKLMCLMVSQLTLKWLSSSLWVWNSEPQFSREQENLFGRACSFLCEFRLYSVVNLLRQRVHCIVHLLFYLGWNL